MNKLVPVVAFAALASLVGGCAIAPPASNVDSQKVAAIDRAARSRGVQVIWLNYPQRKEAVAIATPAVPAPAATGT